MDEISKAKPASTKGRYIISISLSTTMGPGINVDPAKATERDIFPEGTGTGEKSETAADAESVPA